MSHLKLDQQSISTPQILILSDFDGTMTRMEGKDTINKYFYKKLFNGALIGEFRNWTLKNSEEVQSEFKKEFGDYQRYLKSPEAWEKDKDKVNYGLLIPPKVVQFYKNRLKDSDTQLVILTRNRDDYVKEVLKYHGFTEDELKQIKIQGVGSELNAKKTFAKQVIRDTWPENQKKKKWVCVYDDSLKDRKSMKEAVEERGDLNLVAPDFTGGELNTEECEGQIRKIKWDREILKVRRNKPLEIKTVSPTGSNKLELQASENEHGLAVSTNVHDFYLNENDRKEIVKLINTLGKERDSFFSMNTERKEKKMIALARLLIIDTQESSYPTFRTNVTNFCN